MNIYRCRCFIAGSVTFWYGSGSAIRTLIRIRIRHKKAKYNKGKGKDDC